MTRRRVRHVQQLNIADCGAACLAMVLGFHGRHASLDEVRDRIGAGREGVSAFDLLEAGRTFGLRGRAVRLELDDLLLLPAGAILHWRMNHFVVLQRTRKGGAGDRRPRRWRAPSSQGRAGALVHRRGAAVRAHRRVRGRRARDVAALGLRAPCGVALRTARTHADGLAGAAGVRPGAAAPDRHGRRPRAATRGRAAARRDRRRHRAGRALHVLRGVRARAPAAALRTRLDLG